MKRFLGFLGTLVGLGLIVWLGWWSIRSLSHPETGNKSGPIQTAKAERRDITETIELSGEVKPALMTPIKSEISGRILKLSVSDGQAVTAGTPLLELDPSELQSEKTSIERGMQLARLQTARARREYGRMTNLYARAFVPLRDLENAETDLHVQETTLLQQEAQLAKVQERLGKTTLLAPHDGVVIHLDVVPGQVITGVDGMAGGTALMQIVDLNRLLVVSEANELDAVRLGGGMPATIAFPSVPEVSMAGVVKYVSPAAKTADRDQTRSFPVEIACQATDPRIKPGLSASISIPSASVTGVVAVTIAGVFTEGTNHLVYVRAGAGYTNRTVSVGINDSQWMQIRAGLAEGEEIAMQRPDDGGDKKKKDAQRKH